LLEFLAVFLLLVAGNVSRVETSSVKGNCMNSLTHRLKSYYSSLNAGSEKFTTSYVEFDKLGSGGEPDFLSRLRLLTAEFVSGMYAKESFSSFANAAIINSSASNAASKFGSFNFYLDANSSVNETAKNENNVTRDGYEAYYDPNHNTNALSKYDSKKSKLHNYVK